MTKPTGTVMRLSPRRTGTWGSLRVRGRAWLAGLVGVVILLLVLACVALVASGIPRNAAGMAAKGVCSAAFVAHRPADTLMAQDVLPASPVLGLVAVQVDAQNKRVSGSFAGLFTRTAQWLPQRGCVLDMPESAESATVSPAPVAAEQRPWPQGNGPSPRDQWPAGVDEAALQKVLAQAFVGAGDPLAANTRGVAVVHKGKLLVAQTAPGFAPETGLHGWSMAKTVTGMLAYKLAADTGLPLNTPVVKAFAAGREPAWVGAWRKDARSTIQVADLLFMRDGLDNTEGYQPWDDVPRMLWGASDVAAFAAAAPLEAPAASRWRYLSQTANLLAAVTRGRLPADGDYWAYPQRALFEPIGAHSAVMEADTSGNWVGSSYVWASVGDWARLGLLMLNDGQWDGRQVFPPGWLALARTPSVPGGEGSGYGAMTWRYGDPQAGRCKGQVPEDTLAMGGHWGQMVAMVPSRDAVIVRLGWTFKRAQFDECALIADVLKTLPK